MSNDTIGAAGDFTTKAAWSASIKAIGTLIEDEVGELIDDAVYTYGVQSDFDFNAVTLAGFKITLRGVGSGIHDGDFGNGARIEESAAFGGLYQCRKLILEDFSITNTQTSSGGARCFLNSSDSTFRRVIAETKSSGGNSDVFQLSSAGACALEVCRSVGGTVGFSKGNAGTSINHSTALNATIGFMATVTNTSTSKNNVSFACGTGWSGTYSGTYTNNASEDDTHPGTLGVILSGTPFDGDGFTPTLGGQLDGAGTDIGITFDIANNTYKSPPSIGASESIGGGSISIDSDELNQTQAIDNVILAQHGLLTSNDIGQGQLIGNVTLFQSNVLSVNPVNQSQSIDIPVITQQHILSVNEINQNQFTDNIILLPKTTLISNNLIQSQAIDNVSLLVMAVLQTFGLSQIQSLATANLVQHSVLTVNDINQIQPIDNVTIIINAVVLSLNNINQAQSTGIPTIDENALLPVNSLTQAQLINDVFSGGIVIGYLKGEISVFSAYNGEIQVINALTGEVSVFSPLKTK